MNLPDGAFSEGTDPVDRVVYRLLELLEGIVRRATDQLDSAVSIRQCAGVNSRV